MFTDINAALEHLEQQALRKTAPKLSDSVETLTWSAARMRGRRSDGHRQAAVASEADSCFFDYVCAGMMECMVVPAVAQEEVRDTCAALRGYFRFEEVSAECVLWRPGDLADFAFLLVTGHIGVLDEHIDCCRRPNQFVEKSERGQFTGELNLFTGDLRKNTVIATERSSMWTVTRESLETMQREDMKLACLLQGIVLRYASHRMYLSMLDGHVHTV
jgi:hypothetical protein